MKLSATSTEDELRSLVHSIVPLRLDLGEGLGKQTRWLDIEEIFDSELHANEGFCFTTRASIRWPERNLLNEFTVDHVEVVVAPKLVSTPEGVGLVITLRCKDLDIRWVPDFIDRAIVERINRKLAESEVEFRWNLSATLSPTFTQTSARSNIASISLDVSSAKLEIDRSTVHITGPMRFLVDRRPPETLARASLAALPEQASASEPGPPPPESP